MPGHPTSSRLYVNVWYGFPQFLTLYQIISFLGGDITDTDSYDWVETVEDGKKSGITTITLSNVQSDATYTCKVEIDGKEEEKEVSVDMFGEFIF